LSVTSVNAEIILLVSDLQKRIESTEDILAKILLKINLLEKTTTKGISAGGGGGIGVLIDGGDATSF
jgi:hypothetical protein